MKVGFISDLHIYEGPNKDFYLNDEELHKQLAFWLSNLDRLILNGDTIEMWFGKRPTQLQAIREFERALHYFPKSLNLLFTNRKVIVISGNHDALLKDTIHFYFDKKATNRVIIDRLYITHGYYDTINKRFPKLSYFITWFAKTLLMPIFGAKFETRLDQLLRAVGIRVFNSKIQIKKARKIVAKHGPITHVVMGHTHKEKIVPFWHKGKECYYVNTGRYNGNCKDFTTIDSLSGEIIQNKILTKSNIKQVRKKLMKKGKIVSSFNTESMVSGTIKFIDGGDLSHIMITEGNGRILEAVGDGVMSSPIEKYLDGFHNLLVQSFKDKSGIDKIIDHIYNKIGKPYSKRQIVIDLIYILIKRATFGKIDLIKAIQYDFDKEGFVCSELVADGILAVKNKYIKEGVIPANTRPVDYPRNTELLYKECELII